ncbi:MAG: hypothetical protein IJW28_04895 [Clostridia bacterium]|nr:hypothetical protein [Clostridia bacterium]
MNQQNNQKQNTIKNTHTTLSIQNRLNIKLDGVNEVKRSNETEILLKLTDTALTILGNNLTITKLDLEQGILEASGTINTIQYGQKLNLIKRIFK